MLARTPIIALAVAIFSRQALAVAWANFCDDLHCSVNCGRDLDVNNPNCVNQTGRKSLRLDNNNHQTINLAFYPSQDCRPCRNYCVDDIVPGIIGFNIVPAPSCYRLDTFPAAESFRFLNPTGYFGDNCPENDC